jgi:hypothetical protein
MPQRFFINILGAYSRVAGPKGTLAGVAGLSRKKNLNKELANYQVFIKNLSTKSFVTLLCVDCLILVGTGFSCDLTTTLLVISLYFVFVCLTWT